MELPKNITQIGETNPHCKIYVEDYVISYIRQLNQYARDRWRHSLWRKFSLQAP